MELVPILCQQDTDGVGSAEEGGGGLVVMFNKRFTVMTIFVEGVIPRYRYRLTSRQRDVVGREGEI